MSAELERATPPANPRTDGAAEVVRWAAAASAAHDLAVPLCRTAFVPAAFANKPDDATAAILFGAEAGLTPLQALQGVYVISGKPAMYARTLMAVVLGAGHEVWTEHADNRKAIVCGRRRGTDNIEKVTWTIDRAKQAGYTKNPKYSTDAESMLLARAQSDVCRRVAPDAILGMAYSVEELEDDEPAPKASTVRRAAPPRAAIEQAERPPLPDEQPAAPEAATATSRVTSRRNRSVEDAQDVPLPPTNDEPARPAPPPPGDTDPDKPSDAQMRKMHASFNDHGITDRGLRLAYCFDVIGREIASSADLTRAEASQVIERLIEDTTVEAEVVEDYDQPPLPGE